MGFGEVGASKPYAHAHAQMLEDPFQYHWASFRKGCHHRHEG